MVEITQYGALAVLLRGEIVDFWRYPVVAATTQDRVTVRLWIVSEPAGIPFDERPDALSARWHPWVARQHPRLATLRFASSRFESVKTTYGGDEYDMVHLYQFQLPNLDCHPSHLEIEYHNEPEDFHLTERLEPARG